MGIGQDARHEEPYEAIVFRTVRVNGGVLAHGFVRIRCKKCGKDMAVGFSCKSRGFCPSCTGRRMADTQSRLVRDTWQLILRSKMSNARVVAKSCTPFDR